MHEALRYFIESESGKDAYLVDLGFYNGNGKCDCLHFKTRLEPEIAKGSKQVRRCKHIEKARETLADEVIEKLRKQYGSD
jgi:hypothetical protein